VAHANMKAYWQPRPELSLKDNLAAIAALSPWLSNVHVFYWRAGARMPLAGGRASWKRYLDKIAAIPGDRFALLEFVCGDAPEQFAEDAADLTQWLASEGLSANPH